MVISSQLSSRATVQMTGRYVNRGNDAIILRAEACRPTASCWASRLKPPAALLGVEPLAALLGGTDAVVGNETAEVRRRHRKAPTATRA
jgi:hypothetical protein